MINTIALPHDYPDELKFAEEDAPVPTWQQLTRSVGSINVEMTASISRIIALTDDADYARSIWELWTGNIQRSLALFIDKIYNEGWLDSVGHLVNWWDGGIVFKPRVTARGTIADVLASKAGPGGVYTESTLGNGLFAYLNSWNHSAWQRSWMENNAGKAALHVGLFNDGAVEVHLEAYNPLYTNGAPPSEVIEIPFLGSFNYRYFDLHRRWDQSEFAAVARTS
ncbi:MAG TPA: hypothetical protein VLD57_12510, partial [Blastocatellia bacterium]|nr:hypothetical protein [Blastocatellia bacterium]